MKKLLALVLASVLVFGMMSVTAAADSKVTINLWSFTDELQGMMNKYLELHPEMAEKYEINSTVINNDGSAYVNALESALMNGEVDIYGAEADYVFKYSQGEAAHFAVPYADLGIDVKAGIEAAEIAPYTVDIGTRPSDDQVVALAYQSTGGAFIYRRSIAKDVLGTDDPTEVQAALSDWDKFNDVAAQAYAKGYKMLSGFDDSFRTFSNNIAAPWVDGTTINVDENMMKWVDQTKEYTDKGYNNKSSLWDSQWAADQGPTGKVFGFFYSTWGINFTLLGNSLATPVADGEKPQVGNGIYGDYAVCEGPQPYYWGGTWICGAAGSDNIDLIRDVMQKLTCDEAIMKQITLDTEDYTNNEKAMEEIASSDYKSDFLGGQNHIALFAEAAKKIDMSNAGPYDQGITESFQAAFKDYFTGNVDEDTAKENFKTSVQEKYPELTDVVWPA